jgi:hypothetical protein
MEQERGARVREQRLQSRRVHGAGRGRERCNRDRRRSVKPGSEGRRQRARPGFGGTYDFGQCTPPAGAGVREATSTYRLQAPNLDETRAWLGRASPPGSRPGTGPRRSPD